MGNELSSEYQTLKHLEKRIAVLYIEIKNLETEKQSLRNKLTNVWARVKNRACKLP